MAPLGTGVANVVGDAALPGVGGISPEVACAGLLAVAVSNTPLPPVGCDPTTPVAVTTGAGAGGITSLFLWDSGLQTTVAESAPLALWRRLQQGDRFALHSELPCKEFPPGTHLPVFGARTPEAHN